jgi:hypothetical protein
MFTTHRKHNYGPPRPVTGTAVLFYLYMMFIPHRKHRPPWSTFLLVFQGCHVSYILKCQTYLSAKSESEDALASSSRRSEECFPLTVFENTGKCRICRKYKKLSNTFPHISNKLLKLRELWSITFT